MFRNMRVGRPKGKSGKNAYPLRKVVERYAHEELLDCGHIIPTPRDFIGETNYCIRILANNMAHRK